MSAKIIALTRTGSDEVLYLNNFASFTDELCEATWRPQREKAWHLDSDQARKIQIELLQAIADRGEYLSQPQWLHTADMVSVIDADIKQPYFLKLKAIVFAPTFKTNRQFDFVVRKWLDSWTVTNNYQPVITVDIDHQLRMYAAKFELDFNSAVGNSVIPQGSALLEHFRFEYTQSAITMEQYFYISSGTWSANGAALFEEGSLRGKKVNHG